MNGWPDHFIQYKWLYQMSAKFPAHMNFPLTKSLCMVYHQQVYRSHHSFYMCKTKNDASAHIKTKWFIVLTALFIWFPFCFCNCPAFYHIMILFPVIGSLLPAFKLSALLLNYKQRLFWSFIEPWLPPFCFCSTEHLLYGILGVRTFSHLF